MVSYPETIPVKKCAKCKNELTVDNFHKSTKNSYASRCKKCRKGDASEYHKRIMQNDEKRANKNARVSNWRKNKLVENPEYYKEQYYSNHECNKQRANNFYHNNHDKILISQRKWQKENRKTCRNASNQWYANNKNVAKIYHSSWTKINKEHVRIYNAHKRAAKRNATIQNFTDTQLHERMSVFGFKCAYCCVKKFEHIDHVIPLSRGGKHCLSNLRPACQFCNLSKHNKKLSEWLLLRASK